MENAVKNSTSVYGVMRHLGISEKSGSMHFYISKLINKYGLDRSHFLGIRSNHGPAYRGGAKPLSALDVLIKRDVGHKRKSAILHRVLLEIGRLEACEECGLGTVWHSRPLVLQVDHRNGDVLDDREINLRFLCPNCHTQTPNYARIKKSHP